jgi:hypothetical protein
MATRSEVGSGPVMNGDSLAVQLDRHENGFLMVPCTVEVASGATPMLYDFDLMLNTGRPMSNLSLELRDVLAGFGLLDEIAPQIYRIRGVRMSGMLVTPLIARASRGPRLLGFDGMLGLQFLDQFAEVCYDRTARLLRLTR